MVKQRKSMADILAAAVRKQLNTPAYDEAVESIGRITTQANAVREEQEKAAQEIQESEQNQEDIHNDTRHLNPTPLPDTTGQHQYPTPVPDTTPKKQRVAKAPRTPAERPKTPRTTRKAQRLLLDGSLKNFMPQKAKIIGDQQVRLYEWLKGQGGRIHATGNAISELTEIPLRSLRRILQRWETIGVIKKQADAHSTALELLVTDVEAYGTKGPRTNVTPPASPPTASGAEVLRKPEAPAAYEELYPLLSAAGFGPQQFRNAVDAAAQAGLETEPFDRYLVYAEYELEHDCMVDAKGDPVTNPQNWMFKCLRSGSYRVPKGYISPLEAQRRALEEELNAEREERGKLEALQAEQLELALEKEVDRLTRLVLELDDAFSRQVLDRLSPYLQKLDRESPVFLSGIRRELRGMLTEDRRSILCPDGHEI